MAGALGVAGGLAGCGDDRPLAPTQYRMVGLRPALVGSCADRAPVVPPALPAASRARLTYLDASTRLLRCDVVLPLDGATPVVAVPDEAAPVDLVVEYLDDVGEVVGRGETRGIALDRGGVVEVEVIPSDTFACGRDQPVSPRAFHAAVPLPDGGVLLLGGVAGSGGGAEVGAAGWFLQPQAERVAPDGSVQPVSIPGLAPRAMHQAYVVAEDDAGFTLAVVGGLTVVGDPATTPVLVAGTTLPLEPGAAAVAAAGELLRYDRATATFTRAPAGADQEVTPRALAAAVTTGDGPRAWLGGRAPDGAAVGTPLATADRIGPDGVVTPSVPLRRPRVGATVTALDADRLLVWGGDVDGGSTTASPELGELLDGWSGPAPASVALTVVLGTEVAPHRAFGAAARAGSGAVIVAGGYRYVGDGTATTRTVNVAQRLVLDGTTVTLDTIATSAEVPTVGYPAAATTPDGDVVVAGGNPDPQAGGCPTELAGLVCATGAAWRYDDVAGVVASTGPLGVPRFGHALTVLPDGRVLATGGLGAAAGVPVALADLELFEPRGTADDPLAPGFVRAPGDVARLPTGEPIAPCEVVTTLPDAAP